MSQAISAYSEVDYMQSDTSIARMVCCPCFLPRRAQRSRRTARRDATIAQRAGSENERPREVMKPPRGRSQNQERPDPVDVYSGRPCPDSVTSVVRKGGPSGYCDRSATIGSTRAA